MAPGTADPAFQCRRITPLREHLRIVIALQHQGVTVIQHGHHMRCDMARIGQYPEPPRAISENKLNRFASIVRNREWMHANIAD